MKKIAVLSFGLILLSVNVFAFSIICDDFYLNDTECISGGGARALPNTLRLKVFRGETEKLSADSEGGSVILWEMVSGARNFEIYPEGSSCTVYGKELGEGSIKVGSPGGGFTEIAIVVEEREEIRQRSFEPEEPAKEEKKISPKIMDAIVVLLFSLSVIALSMSGIFYFKRR